jgi:hypothetical protein
LFSTVCTLFLHPGREFSMQIALLAHVSTILLRSRRAVFLLALLTMFPVSVCAKVIVFWQPNFPTVASQPVEQSALERALSGMHPLFADIASLNQKATLDHADLLILPYGSAVPVEAWKSIDSYLHGGGNLLVLGGQPLQVPVLSADGKYEAMRPQDTYARTLDFRHTYEVPVPADAQFAWKQGYALGVPPRLRAKRFFTVEGRLNGLGYMSDSTGLLVAAPVIVADYSLGPMMGSRVVALDFEPEPGYWQSDDGVALIRQSASYARRGTIGLSIETLFSAIRPGELPVITAHLHNPRQEKTNTPETGELKVTLSSESKALDTQTLIVPQTDVADLTVPFHKPLPAGFYKVAAVYSEGGEFRAFYQNGFWVGQEDAVKAGPVLATHGDFITRDAAPFFPVGSNYFSTESNGWDFSGPRNAWVWEQDFAEMEQHGVSFVRTGVWMPNGRFIENNAGGGANERFLRNLEAFLLCAQRHHIAVNFTFFAFSPRSGMPGREDPNATPSNPYLDPYAVRMEQAYVRSVVERFKNVPWLSWDLINEPSFSNPRVVFHGNVPNGDPSEVAAWHKWLRRKYDDKLATLADAWAVPAEQLGGFDTVPLPSGADLNYGRSGNPRQVRAVDYNLFAQDMFSDWVHSMVSLIRTTGSRQLVDVGQDEGGVTDRVLNQFYGGAGVSFTTNHTYWQDDALLWDSVAAKRPGIPNITGETGYQPAWAPDGAWRYDEFTGLGLTERKWALGFAAGSTGEMQWDWDREVDFGMKRSDGSSKVWENQMRDLGEFARKAAPSATALMLPEVAIVLPQSLQLSAAKAFALEAQQNAVRALYGLARSQAYAVGEYQIDLLGSPKLILLPSPFGLTDTAWQAITERVKAGATLLVTGPFDGDAHLHATGRQDAIGVPYNTVPLTIRDHAVHFPWGDEELSFTGNKTTVLSQAQTADDGVWVEKTLGKGKVLFSALPLELSNNLELVGKAYRYALKAAGVAPVYTTTLTDPGILIVPTVFPAATLYVLTSESNRQQVAFEDVRSGHHFAGTLESGSAAILLVGTDGKILAAYNWMVQ